MTLAQVLKMPWGGNRNLALWALWGGMPAAKKRGIEQAFVGHYNVQVRCKTLELAIEVRSMLGKKAVIVEQGGAMFNVWRPL